ncbi:hypothetical protein B0T25DRAFT_8696 [Lasiosphaeria hispida]|uniref:Protein kinase domain-containing protein n=1 Tax=Lasiosphaeria hispida TaxID=260671 RepID=A0AAJ0HTP6_9PEZI|nr:hypothetical protein B0T25DRAFT_8696 [Lasiosphaeria hispida]
MEIAGLTLGTVAIVDPFIKAIRGLRQIYDAIHATPEVLDRLEQDGRTIGLYINCVEEAIGQDPSGYPDKFICWLQDEKKLLERSTAQIEDYARRIQQRSQSAPLVHSMKTVFDVTDISKVQEQLSHSISVIGHMMVICKKDSFDSRMAALRGEKSKRLRAQTSSSLAGQEESLCNVSSSLDESGGGGGEEPRPFQEELKRSKPYRRVALKELFSPSHRNEGYSSSSAPTHPSESSQRGQIQPPKDGVQPQMDSSTAISTTLLPLTLSTHSLSLQAPSSSTPRNTMGDTASFPTGMTSQTGDSSSPSEHENRQSCVPVRVEVEGLGIRGTELGRNGNDVDIDAVIAVIQSLRVEILTTAGIDTAESSTRSKDKGITAYKATDASEVCERWPLSGHFLAGAFEQVDEGKYARFEVFEIFALRQEEEEPQVTSTLLDVRAPRNRKGKGRASLPFPSIETVFRMHWHCPLGAEAQPLLLKGSSTAVTWSLKWFARSFIIQEMAYAVMPDGPEWQQRQYVAKGGSSDVWRVKGSSSHHAHFRDPGPFALKVLKPGHEHTFRRELEALKRLAPTNHPHIVTLLMAYERKGTCHLLFPWADGSLSTFWQSTSMEPTSIKRSLEFGRWMASQCHGIAEGLEAIHSYKRGDNRYGRHGDLKPENILWYKSGSNSSSSSDKLGRLVISDFGLAEFPSTDETTKKPRKERGATLAYAPPEFNRLESDSSMSYDIWSLGCIYLEFVTWLVSGWKGVRSFYQERLKDGWGPGPGGIVHHDKSAGLHPSLSDQISRIRAILDGRRRQPGEELRIGIGLPDLLSEYCDVVERCLSLRPIDRPVAKEVAECLRTISEKMKGIISGESTPESLPTKIPLIKLEHDISTESSLFVGATSTLELAGEPVTPEMSHAESVHPRSTPHPLVVSKKGSPFPPYSSDGRERELSVAAGKPYFDFAKILPELGVDIDGSGRHDYRAHRNPVHSLELKRFSALGAFPVLGKLRFLSPARHEPLDLSVIISPDHTASFVYADTLRLLGLDLTTLKHELAADHALVKWLPRPGGECSNLLEQSIDLTTCEVSNLSGYLSDRLLRLIGPVGGEGGRRQPDRWAVLLAVLLAIDPCINPASRPRKILSLILQYSHERRQKKGYNHEKKLNSVQGEALKFALDRHGGSTGDREKVT